MLEVRIKPSPVSQLLRAITIRVLGTRYEIVSKKTGFDIKRRMGSNEGPKQKSSR